MGIRFRQSVIDETEKMLKVVVGHSEDPESQDAIEEVLEQCTEALADRVPQAGILFAAIDFEYDLILQEIHQVFPQLELIGCTTDGEISSILGFQQGSIALMLFCSDTIEIRAGVGYGTQKNAIAAAKQAVQQATQNCATPPQLCITIPASYVAEGITTSGEAILEGLNLALNSQVPIVGGTAGDRAQFKKTYQFFGTEVLSDALPVLIFSGNLLCSYGTACGWQTMGGKSLVTKARGTVLYEVDGKPALEFYQKYLGDRPPNQENPLAVYQENSDRYYMRVPNLYDLETGSITFLGYVPEQAVIQLTEVSRDRIIDASKSSFNLALERYPGIEPEAVLLFSCCCRRWVLGTRTKEEYQLVQKAFPQTIPTCGFYTYGEFAPLETNGSNTFHQETFITLLLGTK